jgi:hypothetical protein
MLLLPLLFVCVYAVYSASPLKILSGCIRMTDREQGERGNQRPFSGGLGVRTVRCGTRHHCPCSTILSRSEPFGLSCSFGNVRSYSFTKVGHLSFSHRVASGYKENTWRVQFPNQPNKKGTAYARELGR